ncbi:hypothetical protein MPTK1_6g16640 [Marchantia polymorpha subsp. ruderalis]|uniref:Uncharacterized protein n=2 Tax=Marchantia polymorpha TaxID=3197 RepID=A0AAF6BSS4_MARPO|nr:hypothetical protein MARPO_0170s0013 [Marchantia polymorpha]BBN15058.1 hypothetical protein Mp_6g16640 [Marchantia polymorpha subsp. ruderalis]|eukprot:PTQ28209.1 hypothetical protein MARPO_0170s0013 [Marchantia polymorpha]
MVNLTVGNKNKSFTDQVGGFEGAHIQLPESCGNGIFCTNTCYNNKGKRLAPGPLKLKHFWP